MAASARPGTGITNRTRHYSLPHPTTNPGITNQTEHCPPASPSQPGDASQHSSPGKPLPVAQNRHWSCGFTPWHSRLDLSAEPQIRDMGVVRNILVPCPTLFSPSHPGFTLLKLSFFGGLFLLSQALWRFIFVHLYTPITQFFALLSGQKNLCVLLAGDMLAHSHLFPFSCLCQCILPN